MTGTSEQKYGFLSNAVQRLTVVFLIGISKLPFFLLYLLSDCIGFMLKNVFHYRRKVIEDNLGHAFPERSKTEIIQLRNKFYKHLADVFLESVKLYSISEKELARRVTFVGLEEMNKYADAGKGVILLAYHHNNWEWETYLQTLSRHHFLMVYNKMRDNEPMDNFLLRARERWGGHAVQMGRAAKVAFDLEKQGTPPLVGLIADQSALADLGSWAVFLNREASFFSGPEKIARKGDFPVFIQKAIKTGRGRYTYEISMLAERPSQAAPNEILLSYIRNMEEAIREAPEYYLWSHRRWKHVRPENLKLIH